MECRRKGGERGAGINLGRTRLVCLRKCFFRAADHGVGTVNGLQDIEVKLFAARHANVETVLLNRVVDALGILREDFLRAFKRRVVERGAVDRSKYSGSCGMNGVSKDM